MAFPLLFRWMRRTSMKVDVSKQLGKGVIILPKSRQSNAQQVEWEFDIDTLADWYPLNLNYEYRYSTRKEDMYLVSTDSKGVNNSYQIKEKKTKSEANNREAITCINWNNDLVKERNREVMAFAKGLGITTFQDEWNNRDIADSFVIVSDCLDNLKRTIGARFKEFHKKDEVQGYVNGGLEEKEIIMFNYINEDEQEIYFKLGEIYTMLNLMKKGV